jgi:hypothetical protein
MASLQSHQKNSIMLKLNELDDKLRQRIQRQIAQEDAAKAGAVAGLQNPKPEQRTVSALDRRHAPQKRGARPMGCCITIISVRRRLLDSDNLAGGSKGLRDAIADSLGLDDGDRRLRWQYQQIECARGREGTIVMIEQL